MKKIELAKTYNPTEVEDSIYEKWENSGYFNPDNLSGSESFVISMPPPNATGVLHTGHAEIMSVEDLMTRYGRMKGKKALWLPGTDHAAIATQNKVEKILAKEGLDRHELGREKFLQRVDEFVDDSRATIKNQIKKMGSSCDWSREHFTLDDGLTVAVRTAFKNMYEDGLIYRGHRIVNWCPRCQSTLSDDEVEYQDQKGKLYYFKYGPFEVATTRPETKIGDTALAVNPNDERYKEYIGQDYEVDFGKVKVKVKVIGDDGVDPEFGSGVLGVTPAHSQVDYAMAMKNKLPVIQVIGTDGKMTKEAGVYAGMSVDECREAFVSDLKQAGLFVKEEEIDNKLSVCYRCATAVEPLTSDQWFVAVDKPFKLKDKSKLNWNKDEATLKELAIHVVESGLIKIIPERFEKTYFHWMENLHDWCISRQIWYGHQIPVWYKDKDKSSSAEVYVGVEPPVEGGGWIQDSDTLDTWFSSALWTFSTLGWPKETDDLKNFHPTTVMETGYDIIFFWVARMILMTTYHLNDIPFKYVYLHGLVRDEQGRKMSKSLGDAMDPLELIASYGTDALRLSMLIGNTPGNDFKLSDEKVAGFRNFVNKLWNISRFVLQGASEVKLIDSAPQVKTLADEWILNQLNHTIKAVSNHLDNFRLSSAGEVLQDFTWNDFADWYIEVSKIEGDKDEVLLYVLQNILKMWHPFCPFVTEEIWQHFQSDKLLMIEKWPVCAKASAGNTVVAGKLDSEAINDFDIIKQIIVAIRNLRGENKIEPAKLAKVVMISSAHKDLIDSQKEVIKKLGRCEDLEVVTSGVKPEQSAVAVVSGVEIYLLLEGLVDFEAEKERLNKEITQVEDFIKKIKIKLGNKEFVSHAPEAVVKKEQDKLKEQEDRLERLRGQIKS